MDKNPLLSDDPKGVPAVLKEVNVTVPPQDEGLLAMVPLPTTENIQNFKEMVCTRTAYKAEELFLAANSHSAIGVLLAGLALMLTAEVGLFTLFIFGEKSCEEGKVLAGVAITFAVICLLFSLFTYWQVLQIELMFSHLQGRQCLLQSFMADERVTMQWVAADDDHTRDKNLKVVNDLCDSISEPLRLQKLLLFYKVLVCILATSCNHRQHADGKQILSHEV